MPEINRVTTLEEVDSLLERSRQRPVLVFKHSLICPVSRRAMNELERFVDGREAGDRGEYALVEIQNARQVSGAIAERTGVRHESPQAILLRDAAVAWHASHGRITVASLTAALDG